MSKERPFLLGWPVYEDLVRRDLNRRGIAREKIQSKRIADAMQWRSLDRGIGSKAHFLFKRRRSDCCGQNPGPHPGP